MHLVSASSEFCDYILWQETSVAAGHIHIDIFHAGQAVEYRLEFSEKLNLVKKHVVHTVVFYLLLQIRIQHIRVAELLVFERVKGDLDDMSFICPFREQMIFENVEQKIGFSTPSHSGYDFDQSIMLLAYQCVKVTVSLDLHV